MIISKSLPINFWLSDDDSYNESEICGVYPDCFCEHVNHDEYITLQFNHNAAITLKAYDQDGNLITSEAMTSVGGNYYQLKFKPNEFVGDETIKVIRFTVTNGAGTELAKSGCIIIGGCVDYPIVPMPTSTLTFFKYESGDFYFTLSDSVPANIIINSARVDGYVDSFCSVSHHSDLINTPNQITILSGNTSASGTGGSPLTGANVKYAMVDLIKVNGTNMSNGDTKNIGGTIVTVLISTECRTYIP